MASINPEEVVRDFQSVGEEMFKNKLSKFPLFDTEYGARQKNIAFSEVRNYFTLHCPLPWRMKRANCQGKVHINTCSRSWYLISIQELQDPCSEIITPIKTLIFWKETVLEKQMNKNKAYGKLVAFFKGILSNSACTLKKPTEMQHFAP